MNFLKLSLALFMLAGAPLRVLAGDQTVLFATNDVAMSTAIESARASLPKFLKYGFGDNRSLAGTSLKVKLPTPLEDIVEVIWLSEIVIYPSGEFQGLLANEPNNLGDLNAGDRVSFRENQIADWAYFSEDGQLFGNFTTRVMLPDLPTEQQNELSAILSAKPVPEAWR